MRVINIAQKTGFSVKDVYTPVIIRDFRGILFYSTEDQLPRVKQFNLPPLGKFIVDSGYFAELDSPVKYNAMPVPQPERVLEDPTGFDISFGVNPNKCTINFGKKTIFFDNAFKEKPLPELYFVLYHEFAHRYFKTEKYTDMLAYNYMLAKGFNPGQIGRAHIMSLSSRQSERKMFNINHLIRANGN